jgi:ectoine hydroxylase
VKATLELLERDGFVVVERALRRERLRRLTAAVDRVWLERSPGGEQLHRRQNVDLRGPRPRLSLKVAYFLTDVEQPEQGALWVLRGSHVHDVLARPPDGRAHPDGAEPLLVPAGTAVVLDRRLWHARGDNRSTTTRKALFYAYTYRWIRLRDPLLVDPERLRALDPVRRQLVGYVPHELSPWFPGKEEAPLAVR